MCHPQLSATQNRLWSVQPEFLQPCCTEGPRPHGIPGQRETPPRKKLPALWLSRSKAVVGPLKPEPRPSQNQTVTLQLDPKVSLPGFPFFPREKLPPRKSRPQLWLSRSEAVV